jgi:hypothetical protein
MMKKLERFFSVLERKKFDRLPFTADICWWYRVNKERNTLPKEYEHMDLIEVARATGVIAQVDTGFYKIETEDVKRIIKTESSEIVCNGSWDPTWAHGFFSGALNDERLGRKRMVTVMIETPIGKLRTMAIQTPSSEYEWWVTEFPVKNREDMRVMKYILDHSRAEPAFEEYIARQKSYGDDGLALPVLPHSPVNRIIYDYMGPQRGLIALLRYQKEVEDLMLSIERLDDEIYQLAEKLPSKIFQFGEHVHSDLDDPRIFKKYQIPYFRKRIAQLHARGKICYCHWDGYFEKLLHLIKETGFDAIEGVTPKPSGDVSLAELRDAVEGKVILWGGIPASLFCEPYTDEQFKEYVLDMLKTIAPGDGFIVGLGDNLGPTGYIHRVKLVNDILEEHGYYPIHIE